MELRQYNSKNIDELKDKNKVPIFLIVRYDLLREILGENTARRTIKEVISSSMIKNDICIITVSHSDKSENKELREFATAIIKVFEEHGKTFIYGEKPYIQLFGITFQEKENHIESNFIPVA